MLELQEYICRAHFLSDACSLKLNRIFSLNRPWFGLLSLRLKTIGLFIYLLVLCQEQLKIIIDWALLMLEPFMCFQETQSPGLIGSPTVTIIFYHLFLFLFQMNITNFQLGTFVMILPRPFPIDRRPIFRKWCWILEFGRYNWNPKHQHECKYNLI